MVLLTPLGLLAALSVIPLVIAYLVRPDPRTIRLPTLSFLTSGEDAGTDRSAFERLRIEHLLVVQAVVLVLIALALASPFVTTTGTEQVRESVVVLDTSASMTVADADGATRFARAQSIAREELAETTSLVTAGPDPVVAVRRGSQTDASDALSAVTLTENEGRLADAISRAVAIADRSARIVIVSDFAGETAWRSAVETARNRGYTVDVRQVGGRVDNVGIVAADYEQTTVTVSIKNYADSEVTRTVTLGNSERSVTLAPGDVGTVTLPVTVGNEQLRLRPGDSFPVDDRLFVAGPDSPQVRVLLLTNDEDRFVRTALSVLPAVDLTVSQPPTTIAGEYDVVVFGSVDPDRLLQSTRGRVAELVRNGAGVVVTAQPRFASIPYGDLSPVTAADRPQTGAPTIQTREDPLVQGIRFPPPSAVLPAETNSESEAVVVADGSPLVARGTLGEGRTYYYGYLESDAQFQYTYQYPVFWKRLVFEAAGRTSLPERNRQAGVTLSVANGTTVERPAGTVTSGGSVRLDRTGFYRVGEQRYGVSLVSEPESNVSAPALSTGAGGIARERDRTVQRVVDLSPLVAIAAAIAILAELVVLRRRGDL